MKDTSSGCFDSALAPHAELACRSARQISKSFVKLRHYPNPNHATRLNKLSGQQKCPYNHAPSESRTSTLVKNLPRSSCEVREIGSAALAGRSLSQCMVDVSAAQLPAPEISCDFPQFGAAPLLWILPTCLNPVPMTIRRDHRLAQHGPRRVWRAEGKCWVAGKENSSLRPRPSRSAAERHKHKNHQRSGATGKDSATTAR